MGNEMIDHPPHYGGDTQYETIKVIEAWGLGFHLGNAVKYIARAGRKIGADCVADLRKAAWYLERAAVGIESPALRPWATSMWGQDTSAALAMATVAAAVAADGTRPVAPRDHAKALLAKAKVRLGNGPRTWPKTCVICGKKFDARSASAKCCSPACVKEKNIRYARAGYQAKKPAAVTPTAKKAAATVGKEKACAACGKMFTPWRKDQKCCSTTCGKSTKAGAARKQTVKPPADPEAAAADAATSASIFPADCAVCGLGFNPRYEGQKTCCTSCAKELGQRNGGQA